MLNASDAALACADDAARLDPADAEYARYLVLPNRRTREARTSDYRICANHVNSLSDRQRTTLPVPVPGTGWAVLRVDLRDYGWRKDTWERLGGFDPYYHVQTTAEVLKPARKKYLKAYTDSWWRRKSKADDWERCDGGGPEYYDVEAEPSREPARALAPYLSDPFPGRSTPGDPARERRLADLVAATKSASPLLYFPWFFRQTALEDPDRYGGKAPGYYSFLKLGDRQEDFERQFALDLDASRFVFQSEIFAAVGRSSVAHNARRLMRWDAIKGGWWGTLDARESTERKNYLRVYDDLDVRRGFRNVTGKRGFAQVAASKIVDFDATEQFRPLPNGLMVWWLANKAGDRQNSAPDFIASDSTAPGTDKRVFAGVSCVRCHVDGVRPIRDWVRNVLAAPLTHNIKDPLAARRQQQLYGDDLDGAVEADQAVYRRAVFRSTCTPGHADGLTTREFNRAYREFWAEYDQGEYGLGEIALMTGLDRKAVLFSIDAVTRKAGGVDPLIAGLLRAVVKGGKDVGMRSDHLEEVFPVLMMALKGYVPVPAKPD